MLGQQLGHVVAARICYPNIGAVKCDTGWQTAHGKACCLVRRNTSARSQPQPCSVLEGLLRLATLRVLVALSALCSSRTSCSGRSLGLLAVRLARSILRSNRPQCDIENSGLAVTVGHCQTVGAGGVAAHHRHDGRYARVAKCAHRQREAPAKDQREQGPSA